MQLLDACLRAASDPEAGDGGPVWVHTPGLPKNRRSLVGDHFILDLLHRASAELEQPGR